MSKIFDSLKRAEEERRTKASQHTVADERDSAAVPERPPGTTDGSISTEFARELGVLQNSLNSALKGKARKTLLFTSSAREEGATTLAVNYAKMVAMQGQETVLLCEMNARYPALAGLFSIDGSRGISDVLSGRQPLSAVVHRISEYGLSVAPIGTQDPASIQLLLSRMFPRLLEQALAAYSMVILDAPAITMAPETAPMAPFVDGVVLVVQTGRTKREVIQRSINAISQQDGKVLGIILNRKKYYIPEFLYKRV
ncbi:MAG: CpsD/CapB family tyrosine-protein kinase [Chitinivibrionia bacterium]|nr:CpsD/CapB family tyrosine-protein kinase [Chitinivibrionia bacterium]